MRLSRFVGCVLSLLLIWLCPGFADDKPNLVETAEQQFEKSLAKVLEDPQKGNWKALRESFSATRFYKPYDIEVTERLKTIAESIGEGKTKKCEAELITLIESERYMRIDSVAMLMMLYQKTDQPKAAEKYENIVRGILGVLKDPENGTSWEKPIQILYIQEEYLVTTNMDVKDRGLSFHDGHAFDLCTLRSGDEQKGSTLYFNIDLPRKSLSKSHEKRK